MALTIKDLIATIFAAGVGYVTYANIKGIDVALFQNPRIGITILFVLGLVVCAMSGTPMDEAKKSTMVMVASILGGLALVIFLWGLITGNRLAITAMGVNILILWAVTTLRHLLAN